MLAGQFSDPSAVDDLAEETFIAAYVSRDEDTRQSLR